jgi:hypothetical protein
MSTVPESIITKPEWRRLINAQRAAVPAHVVQPPKRSEPEAFGPDWRAWVDAMLAVSGIFATVEPMPNWLNNDGGSKRLAWSLKRFQRNYAFQSVREWLTTVPQLAEPFTVTLTRYGPKVLDTDGLAASLKYFRDGVAAAMGIDDGETDRIRFVPAQEYARWYGLRIQIGGGE